MDCGGGCPEACPDNTTFLIFAGMGGVAAAGGLAYNGIKGRRPPSRQPTREPRQPTARESTDQPRLRREPTEPSTSELPDQLRTARRLADRIRTARESTDQPQITRESTDQPQITRESTDQPRLRREPTEPSTSESSQPAMRESTDQPRLKGEDACRSISENTAMESEPGERIAEETHQTGKKIMEKAVKKTGKKLLRKAAKKVKTKVEETTKAEDTAKGVTVGDVLSRKSGVIRCPQCGEELPPGSRACSKCGYNF